MLRRTCLPIVLLGSLCAIGAASSACAQDRERAESMFRSVDRDNNEVIDAEEFRRLSDGTRERLQKLGIAGTKHLNKEEFIAGITAVEEMRRKEREQESSQRGSSSSSSLGRDSSRSRDGKSKPKERLTLELPAQYTAMDKNHDGQIGLYEWDRAKVAEFKTLDRNGDGFLTPRELVNATTSPAVTASTTTTGSSSRTVSSTARPGSSTPPPGTPASPASTAATEDPLERSAKTYFGFTDKDKDGVISQEEWAGSRGVRPMFEKASVAPTFPLSQEKFVEQFKQIKQTQK